MEIGVESGLVDLVVARRTPAHEIGGGRDPQPPLMYLILLRLAHHASPAAPSQVHAARPAIRRAMPEARMAMRRNGACPAAGQARQRPVLGVPALLLVPALDPGLPQQLAVLLLGHSLAALLDD